MSDFGQKNGNFTIRQYNKKYRLWSLIIIVVALLISVTLGGVFVKIGIHKMLLNVTPEHTAWNLQQLVLICFGSALLLIPVAVIINRRRTGRLALQCISFSNTDSSVIIKDKIGEAFIPYSDIQSINKRIFVETKKSKNHTTKTSFYICYIKKTDGSMIDLYNSTDENTTLGLFNALKKYYAYDGKTISSGNNSDPIFIKEKTDNSAHIYYWKSKKVSWSVFFMIIPFELLLVSLLISNIQKEDIMAVIIISLFLILSIAGIIFIIRYGMKSSRDYESIRVTDGLIEKGYFSEHDNSFTSKKKRPLTHVQKVCFSYKCMNPEIHQIVLMSDRKSSVEPGEENDEVTDGLTELADMVDNNSKKNMSFTLTGCYTSDIFKFEKKIQESIAKFGGYAV